MRSFTTPPEQLVIDGTIQLGCFNGPVKRANLIDAKGTYKLPLPRFLRSLQLREWQAFQIGNEDYFIMIAIYNAKKMALAQFILYDKKANKKYRYEKKIGPWQLEVPDTLFGGTAAYSSSNFKLNAFHDLNQNLLTLDVDIQGFQNLPNVKGRFNAEHNTGKYAPMVVSMPFSEKRSMYSHKCLMPLEGKVSFDGINIEFSPENSNLILDDHKGYYPFPTRYDWVTGLGMMESGQRVGFNLTDNQVINKDVYNENCLWLDGVLHPLPPVKVGRPEGYKESWHIKDRKGQVNLVFTPVMHTAVNVNLLLFQSKYQGPYGYFNGYLSTKDGKQLEIRDLFGMGEDFYLRI